MSLEANKIAAAILVGGMLTLSVGLVANIIYGGHEGAEQGEKAAAPAQPAGGAPVAQTAQPEGAQPAGEAAAAPAASEDAVKLIASADPAAGEKVAMKCEACH